MYDVDNVHLAQKSDIQNKLAWVHLPDSKLPLTQMLTTMANCNEEKICKSCYCIFSHSQQNGIKLAVTFSVLGQFMKANVLTVK